MTEAVMETGEFKTQSESISKIALALSKAQAKMTTAKRTAENPFFKSKYADLSAVWDAVREPLAEFELAVVQTPIEDVRGTAIITTLAHSSGEWFRSKLFISPKAKDAQSVGSAITYARRYALSAITGIAPDDDDDGEKATRPIETAKAKAAVATVKQGAEDAVSFDNARTITGIQEMLGKMNGGDEDMMNNHLKQLTKWNDKTTKEEKFLTMADLAGVAKNKPQWLSGIHKKVSEEYQRAFDAQGNPK